VVDSVQGDFTLGFCFQLNLKVKKQIGRYIGIDIGMGMGIGIGMDMDMDR
jgi:tetrahydromethanopterin S-methyltransferase subunit G